jgi:hypothetical protein
VTVTATWLTRSKASGTLHFSLLWAVDDGYDDDMTKSRTMT